MFIFAASAIGWVWAGIEENMTPESPKNHLQPSPSAVVRASLASRILKHMPADGLLATAVPGLELNRRSAPTACASATYQPRLIVFVQGRKRINLGRETILCDESTFLLTSVELPVVSQVVQATAQAPMLGLVLCLDMPEVRRILSREEFPVSAESSGARGMAVGVSSPELLDACSRLLDLLDAPQDIPFLSGLIQREILYRLLRSPQGQHLQAIATAGQQGHRTAKAVAWLRANYTKPLRIEELAGVAQMGLSTLHHHFRALTAMSPLQYQKHLRLHVARERMLHDDLDVTGAAYAVGYESVSQFNREYSRFFGQPPMRDVKAHRAALTEAVHD